LRPGLLLAINVTPRAFAPFMCFEGYRFVKSAVLG
jgi:hypothetical protein